MIVGDDSIFLFKIVPQIQPLPEGEELIEEFVKGPSKTATKDETEHLGGSISKTPDIEDVYDLVKKSQEFY